MKSLHASFLALFSLASLTHAGNVLRVGPGQTYTTIQAAVNAAAFGDIVLVDPDVYPPFQVGTAGMGPVRLTIWPSSGTYEITQTAGVPEILVENIPLAGSVTIGGAQILYDDASAPAVRVRNCDGAVRMSALGVTLDSNLIAASVSAAVEVTNADTFWLVDSFVWGTPPVGYTTNVLTAGGIANDGISGFQAIDSSGAIQNSRLSGYQNFQEPGRAGCGGDGARFIGESSFWLLKNLVGQSVFRGGAAVWGGHAIHQIHEPVQAWMNKVCGSSDHQVTLTPGAALYAPLGDVGGFYGTNNSNGAFHMGSLVIYPTPALCGLDQSNEAFVANELVPLGGQLEVQLYTRKNRHYALAISNANRYAFAPPLNGRSLLAFNALVIDTGTTTKNVPLVRRFPIPADPSFLGLQLSLQALTGKVGSPLDCFSLPAMVVIGP